MELSLLGCLFNIGYLKLQRIYYSSTSLNPNFVGTATVISRVDSFIQPGVPK